MQHERGRKVGIQPHQSSLAGGCLALLTASRSAEKKPLHSDSAPAISRWELQGPSLEQGLATKTVPLSKWRRASHSAHTTSCQHHIWSRSPHGMVTLLPRLRKAGHSKDT